MLFIFAKLEGYNFNNYTVHSLLQETINGLWQRWISDDSDYWLTNMMSMKLYCHTSPKKEKKREERSRCYYWQELSSIAANNLDS